MSAAAAPALAVVIPALNEERTIARCLDALALSASKADMSVEVLVIDDGSDDSTSDIALEHGARVIRQPRRAGPLRAWTVGVAATTSPWIVFTDADCMIAPDALRQLASHFASGDDLGVLAGRSIPWSTAGFSSPLLRSARFSALLLHQMKRRLADSDFQPIGRLMAVRRAYWNVDDTTTGPCDKTVAHKAQDAGGRIEYVADAVVYYEPLRTWHGLARDYVRTILARRRSGVTSHQVGRLIRAQAAMAAALAAPIDALSWLGVRLTMRTLAQRRVGGASDLSVRWAAEPGPTQPADHKTSLPDES